MATPVDSSVYYTGIFWNSYDEVIRHLNARAFGEMTGDWLGYVRSLRAAPYRRALSVNCGSGWVERAALEADLVGSIVAIDFLEDLLETARQASVGLPIEFLQRDTNSADFPSGPFDLMINHAAGHHITYLDRVFRRMRELISEEGSLITWDYTGPHRNQYGSRTWAAANAINERLPKQFRSDMRYPHMRTMLAVDPTEAVHSELVIETMNRYFQPVHTRLLGGPIAYLVLTHNQRLFDAPVEVRDDLVKMVIAADVAHIDEFPEDNLFTFSIYEPKSADLLNPDDLARWTRAEEDREANAAVNGGRYYLPTAVEIATYFNLKDGAGAIDSVRNPTSFEVASLGVGFASGALARALLMPVPWLIAPIRRMRNLIRRKRA